MCGLVGVEEVVWRVRFGEWEDLRSLGRRCGLALGISTEIQRVHGVFLRLAELDRRRRFLWKLDSS